MITETGKSKSAVWVGRLETQESWWCSLNPKAICWRIPSCSTRPFFFCLFFVSPIQVFNWLDEAHPHYGGQSALLKSMDLNVNLIQKHLHRNIQENVWPTSWASCDPVKLTHKMNHHRNWFPHGLDWGHAGTLSSSPCIVGCPLICFLQRTTEISPSMALIMSLPFAPGWISHSHYFLQGPADLLAS